MASPESLSLVSSRSPFGARVTERSRPNSRRAAGAFVHLSLPPSPNFMKITRLDFSAATASVPRSLPHCLPVTHAAPEVAFVGLPDRHRAARCLPGSEKSVIGTVSL